MQTFLLSDENLYGQIQDTFGSGGGVYRLHCLDINGHPIGIDRVLGRDELGTLYIGCGSSFLERIMELKKSFSPHDESLTHQAAMRYEKHPGLQDLFRWERLVVDLIGSEMPVALEEQMLRDYFMKFGERPPLNAMPGIVKPE